MASRVAVSHRSRPDHARGLPGGAAEIGWPGAGGLQVRDPGPPPLRPRWRPAPLRGCRRNLLRARRLEFPQPQAADDDVRRSGDPQGRLVALASWPYARYDRPADETRPHRLGYVDDGCALHAR